MLLDLYRSIELMLRDDPPRALFRMRAERTNPRSELLNEKPIEEEDP
jgi:hypothetical protein